LLSGSERYRLPVAAKSAFATDGMSVTGPTSPVPPVPLVLLLIFDLLTEKLPSETFAVYQNIAMCQDLAEISKATDYA